MSQHEQHRWSRRGGIELEQAGNWAEGPRGEYLYALARPPWWSDVYANLALAMEGLARFDLAASTWKLYLRSAPKAADARQVQSRIGEWKHEAERARKQN